MRFLLQAVFLLTVFLSGCAVVPETNPYSERSCWVICDDDRTDGAYDVFYIYPTLAGKAPGREAEWENDPRLRKKTAAFSRTQAYGIFGGNVRVFVPYVHQLTYASVKKIMAARPLTKEEWPAFERGMKESLAAFRYYLKHYNRGRPYILLGHSQGAMDLYYVMEHCKEIRAEKGFVAAYLPGLPHVTTAQIERDFGNRIVPARNGDDIGVIAVWNTQNAEADVSFMAGKGVYCINPLNWRTDAVPAGKNQHLGAYLYDYRKNAAQEKKNMFGAKVDPDRGVLLVDLPSNSVWDAKGFMGRGIFHMNDVWFFAGNIRANADHRIRIWAERKHKCK